MMAFITVLISPPGASFPAAFKDVPQLGAKLSIKVEISKFNVGKFESSFLQTFSLLHYCDPFFLQ